MNDSSGKLKKGDTVLVTLKVETDEVSLKEIFVEGLNDDRFSIFGVTNYSTMNELIREVKDKIKSAIEGAFNGI